MKRSKDMILREIAGEAVLIPTGETAKHLYGIVSLTESGKFLWELLGEDSTEEALVEAILARYEIDRETAAADVRVFLEKLRAEQLLCE